MYYDMKSKIYKFSVKIRLTVKTGNIYMKRNRNGKSSLRSSCKWTHREREREAEREREKSI